MAAPRSKLESLADDVRQQAEHEIREYSPDEDRPLGGYAVLLATYGTLVASLAGIVRLRRARLPASVSAADLALGIVATHKIARVLTKDPVTSVLRAPFTRYSEPTGEGEISEQVRGRGLRHAVGELLTCPFCIAQWIATVFVFGLVVAPRATRLMASVFVLLAGSDLLQIAYAKAQQSLDE